MNNQPESGLWVLRRWNSFTPRIPSIYTGPGGGYFLRWNNKGIAIDPGFDYLDNLQKAGIALKDIHAIITTHSHPDHVADFEPLLMMLVKRHERMQAHGLGEQKRLDLFLSMDTAEKYRQLITQQSPLIVNDTRSPELDSLGTKELPDYQIKIQTLPADHVQNGSEIQANPIRKALSIILHMYSDRDLSDNNRCLSIGFTGDTKYNELLAGEMKKCEIVIAHLGSVDFAKLMGLAAMQDTTETQQMKRDLLETNFKQEEEQAFIDILGLREQSGTSVIKELDDILTGKPTGSGFQSGHLLFEGTLRLFAGLFKDGRARTKLGVVSEFGLELGSFRHKVAEAINIAVFGSPEGLSERRVISGDKDLAIRLSGGKQKCAHSTIGQCNKHGECLKDKAQFLLRCTLCHQWVCLPCIREHSIKHYDQSIFYNCDLDWGPSYYPRPPVIRL